MATIQDYLGARATREGEKITIYLNDLVDENGQILINDPQLETTNGNPRFYFDANGQGTVEGVDVNTIIQAIVYGIYVNCLPQTVNGDVVVEDKKLGILAKPSAAEPTFVIRQDESQIEHELIFAVYSKDNTALDPDNAVKGVYQS